MTNDGALVGRVALGEVEVLKVEVDMNDWGAPTEDDPSMNEAGEL